MKKGNDTDTGRTPFGARLLLARKAKKLTQKQVQDKIGIAQSGLAELEKEGTGSSFVVALALLYGVNPVWLALNKGPMSGGLPAPEWWLNLSEDERIQVESFANNLMFARPQKNNRIGTSNKVSEKTEKTERNKADFPLVSNGN